MAGRVKPGALKQWPMFRRFSVRLLLTTVFAVLQVIAVVFFEILAEGFILSALTISAVLIAVLDAWQELRRLFIRTDSPPPECVHDDCRDSLAEKLVE